MESCPSFNSLSQSATEAKNSSLRTLLNNSERCKNLQFEWNPKNDDCGVHLDLTRQLMKTADLEKLVSFAKERSVDKKISAMFKGLKLNLTENREVLHVALRAADNREIIVDGKNVVKEVSEVLSSVEAFSRKVRNGEHCGFSGKKIDTVVCVGIGGSALGPEFLYEALRMNANPNKQAKGRKLLFLPNIDPQNLTDVIDSVDLETTLVIVVSKTFTTAETMANAQAFKKQIVNHYKGIKECVDSHFVAVSTNIKACKEFGINEKNIFAMWDWVGGRFSSSSAVGVLPLALHFGFDVVKNLLEGMRAADTHFETVALDKNLPVLMALASTWNSSFLRYPNVAIIPYSQALNRFPAHVQQLIMESNGKNVAEDGSLLACPAGEIYFGEPGTNSQHSFFQLLHQGQVVPVEFIGSIESQAPVASDCPVTHHDELMSNFFAQPDALALGKTEEEVKDEGVTGMVIPHKVFPGNRPSQVLLFPRLDAFYIGALLSIYEHRTAVQGWLWGINSFDQWGVELGKVLAKNVRSCMNSYRSKEDAKSKISKLPNPTQKLLNLYLQNS
eukprot:GHVP01059262.1.p1 GENE.GHVP01059262.1~~GHVP01059262.1.p1  ORF type:complete len:566 (+),score=121.15 GHVP01059262.1:23-1699(+)